MGEKIRNFLRVPPEILPAFRQDAFQKNRLSLLVISVMIFGMEAYNIARVLFMSRSGLATANNRFYFGMYCALLLAAVIYLVFCRFMRGAKLTSRLRIQYACVAFAFLWHICLNAYDLMRDPDGEVSIYMTAMLGAGGLHPDAQRPERRLPRRRLCRLRPPGGAVFGERPAAQPDVFLDRGGGRVADEKPQHGRRAFSAPRDQPDQPATASAPAKRPPDRPAQQGGV